jgi:hypothetical protein
MRSHQRDRTMPDGADPSTHTATYQALISTTLTFPVANARVEEANPTTNYGHLHHLARRRRRRP